MLIAKVLLTCSLIAYTFTSFDILITFYLVADMKDGFYEKMETELQGQQNTYYVGGIVAFELTERNSSYAMSLVCKHFADDNLLPKFPYVKVKWLNSNVFTT